MTKPLVTIIAARSRNGVIGKDGKLPWRIPEDLKFFKQKTMGKPVLMGRRTWESIGRPLPGRKNIVVSKSPGYKAEGAQVFHSLEEALRSCQDDEEVMVIGGGAIYSQALPLASRAWITFIDFDFQGDTFFPMLAEEEWSQSWTERHDSTGPQPAFEFQMFERIRNT